VDLLKNFDKVGYGLGSYKLHANSIPRFPTHRRYDMHSNDSVWVYADQDSFHLHRTSRMTLDWIVWTLLRL